MRFVAALSEPDAEGDTPRLLANAAACILDRADLDPSRPASVALHMKGSPRPPDVGTPEALVQILSPAYPMWSFRAVLHANTQVDEPFWRDPGVELGVRAEWETHEGTSMIEATQADGAVTEYYARIRATVRLGDCALFQWTSPPVELVPSALPGSTRHWLDLRPPAQVRELCEPARAVRVSRSPAGLQLYTGSWHRRRREQAFSQGKWTAVARDLEVLVERTAPSSGSAEPPSLGWFSNGVEIPLPGGAPWTASWLEEEGGDDIIFPDGPSGTVDEPKVRFLVQPGLRALAFCWSVDGHRAQAQLRRPSAPMGTVMPGPTQGTPVAWKDHHYRSATGAAEGLVREGWAPLGEVHGWFMRPAGQGAGVRPLEVSAELTASAIEVRTNPEVPATGPMDSTAGCPETLTVNVLDQPLTLHRTGAQIQGWKIESNYLVRTDDEGWSSVEEGGGWNLVRNQSVYADGVDLPNRYNVFRAGKVLARRALRTWVAWNATQVKNAEVDKTNTEFLSADHGAVRLQRGKRGFRIYAMNIEPAHVALADGQDPQLCDRMTAGAKPLWIWIP